MAELGMSGRIARLFQDNQLTPLLGAVGLLLGAFAIAVTPREEEPQIDVTFANVFVAFPGASALEVENLVSNPMEQILSEIDRVEHVYSVSRPGHAVLTVQFEVGDRRNDAIVRLYNAVYSHNDWVAPNLGVLAPLIRPMGIDDVPIVSATLWSADPDRGAHELLRVAHAIESELKRVQGTRNVYTIGGPDNVVHVRLDARRLAGFDVSLDDLRASLQAANVVLHAGSIVAENRDVPVQAGTLLARRDDVSELIVGLHDGRPVYLDDVAEIAAGPDQPEHYVWFGARAPHGSLLPTQAAPAVTIAVAKKPGTNAGDIARQVIARLDALRGTHIPEGVNVTITRNYGQTADDKARKLIQKLLFATASVIVLVALTLGWREAIVVGVAVVVTLALTLFASWVWGFTINRVSLFALIFSIGILVDDAIVVVENIHRHIGSGTTALLEAIPAAVDEVGGPTILATFTVIAALLPMAFVSGLMGPYMSPIPINASTGMVLSLAVALVATPWLSAKLVSAEPRHRRPDRGQAGLEVLFTRIMMPFLDPRYGRLARLSLFGLLALLLVGAVALVGLERVVLKMLPFDNKSELQVVVDMPEGSSVEHTAQVLDELSQAVGTVPEVTHYQAYAGVASPINFNGLVRQYYLRKGPHYGDLQIGLLDKHERTRSSHAVALSLRERLAEIGRRHGASVKIVEVPPGPPVPAPLVAEIYGPQYSGQVRVASALRALFERTADVVDLDDSVEVASRRLLITVDRHRAGLLGVSQASIARAIATALSGEDVTFLRTGHEKYAVPVRLELPVAEKADLDDLLALELRGAGGSLVPLSELVHVRETTWEQAIYHKDLLPVAFVTADSAGLLDSPLYAMFDLSASIASQAIDGHRLEQHFIAPPEDTYKYSIKWDGEWQITYETFRDMGLAYSVGLVLIYLLVVAQFRSYLIPLIIMAPIPLTVLGVFPGHALLGAQFTATSMIGMIALAGIIVRNSILLVDFLRSDVGAGRSLEDAVIRSGAVRARPIVLTALAAMLGAVFILDDPIFNGLAVSLIFGILVSTALTLVVIPLLYYEARRPRDGSKA